MNKQRLREQQYAVPDVFKVSDVQNGFHLLNIGSIYALYDAVGKRGNQHWHFHPFNYENILSSCLGALGNAAVCGGVPRWSQKARLRSASAKLPKRKGSYAGMVLCNRNMGDYKIIKVQLRTNWREEQKGSSYSPQAKLQRSRCLEQLYLGFG